MKSLATILLACLLPLSSLAAQDPVLSAVENYVRQQLQGQPGRISVTAGPLDPRLRLPQCSSYQPYTPSGVRLLGSISVGLRCVGPARWNIFVPVRIAIESTYVATATPLVAGQSIQPDNLLVLTGDLGSLPAGILTDPSQAVGKTVRFSLASGQPLRLDQLLAPLVIQQGQSIQLVFHGPGFTATNEGRALNNAAEGQLVQVRTQSGTVISGIAQSNGTVLIGESQP
ncbi:flagellar basal body P-ring formation chaperone FlgA [Azovibrio restrictus]|uniref:flagellar basal body P-ring formation chaperone FlgA n=1 Tax=Azovibrio restrictus TaxID=146938 RepID=UPI0026F06226|nr:flagellar basal body P-ring formation chaperone FlgA [Azovibrio restrictus]MDD3481922.1 flagellar basal body P-ring formation chaperone FlgA [Azovibrio restrictus]